MKEITGKIVAYSLANKEPESIKESTGVILTDVKLPDDAPARMKTLRAEGRKWYVTVVYHPQSETPFALFCTTNNKEKSAQTSDAVDLLIGLARKRGILEEHIESLIARMANDNNVNKLTRAISLLLRHRVAIADIVNTMDKTEELYVGSFLFQIKKFLSQYIKDGEEVEGGKCGECGSSRLVYSEGCMSCVECGSSKCS